MPRFDHVVESRVSESLRTIKLRALFDVPAQEMTRVEWHHDVPIDEREWNVGLIVGPSGSGKSQLLGKFWPEQSSEEYQWPNDAVITGFSSDLSVDKIAEICSAVGFNTIPAWLRPYRVLSNGERFRVDLARRLSETKPGTTCVVDEFTSVVDRQVGQITSHDVQKYVRRNGLKFVAASCHYDVIDWLQPDWVFEPATGEFKWRSLQRRPRIETEICRVEWKTWNLFSQYHYLNNSLHRSAKCFCAFVAGVPVSIVAVMRRPTKEPLFGVSRGVTLPDWQGIGLVMLLIDTVGAATKSIGARLHTYPAHLNLIHSMCRSKTWKMIEKPGMKKNARSKAQCHGFTNDKGIGKGTRPCAVFDYVGPKMDRDSATKLLDGELV